MVQSACLGSAGAEGSDTLVTVCSEPDVNELVAALCVAGDAATLGADTQIGTCAEPAASNVYVNVACEAGDALTLCARIPKSVRAVSRRPGRLSRRFVYQGALPLPAAIRLQKRAISHSSIQIPVSTANMLPRPGWG